MKAWKSRKWSWLGLLPLVMLIMAGCSTPASRIKRNPELFAGFPPEAREKIRQGQIDLGFTPEMVEMALGKPDRRSTRVTEKGTTDVWIYVSTSASHDMVPLDYHSRYYYRDGRPTLYRDWITVTYWEEFERLRVEFLGGKVATIEAVVER